MKQIDDLFKKDNRFIINLIDSMYKYLGDDFVDHINKMDDINDINQRINKIKEDEKLSKEYQENLIKLQYLCFKSWQKENIDALKIKFKDLDDKEFKSNVFNLWKNMSYEKKFQYFKKLKSDNNY